MKDPTIKLELHNEHQFKLITKKLKDPVKREEHSRRQAMRLEDPAKCEEHNLYQKKKYRIKGGDLHTVILNYQTQIS